MKMDNISIENFNIDEFLTEMVHDTSSDMIQYIYDLFKDSDLSSLVNFQFTLILDTNILFPAVRSKALSGELTFVEKLIDNPSLRVCAPIELEKEIMAKIKQKFPKDKKTKNIDVTEAQQIAKGMLGQVEIIDNINSESIKRANAELASRDPNDTPFMALCFSIKASGILTDDKDFKESESVRTWDTKEAGRIVTVLNKGTLCFAIATGSIAFAVALTKEIMLIFWGLVMHVVSGTIYLLKCGVQLAQKHPFISVLITAGLVIFDIKTGHIGKFTKKFPEFLKRIGELLWRMLQIIGDFSGKTFEAYSVLFEYHEQALKEFALLEAGPIQDFV